MASCQVFVEVILYKSIQIPLLLRKMIREIWYLHLLSASQQLISRPFTKRHAGLASWERWKGAIQLIRSKFPALKTLDYTYLLRTKQAVKSHDICPLKILLLQYPTPKHAHDPSLLWQVLPLKQRFAAHS